MQQLQFKLIQAHEKLNNDASLYFILGRRGCMGRAITKSTNCRSKQLEINNFLKIERFRFRAYKLRMFWGRLLVRFGGAGHVSA